MCLNSSLSFADVEKRYILISESFILKYISIIYILCIYITETFPRREICQKDGKLTGGRMQAERVTAPALIDLLPFVLQTGQCLLAKSAIMDEE